MERSMVGAEFNSWTGRVSSSARLEDVDDPAVITLNRRIQMVTGLDVMNRTGYEQEMLQVSSRWRVVNEKMLVITPLVHCCLYACKSGKNTKEQSSQEIPGNSAWIASRLWVCTSRERSKNDFLGEFLRESVQRIRGLPPRWFQVCEYGTGGHFAAHHDFLNLRMKLYARSVPNFFPVDWHRKISIYFAYFALTSQ